MRFADRTLAGFVDDVASPRIAPAGGTAAAVVGAIGAALGDLTCIHTLGRDGYADVEDEIAEIHAALGELRTSLFELADEDAEALDDLRSAGDDESGRAAARRAVEVPLAIAEACRDVTELTTAVAERGNRNAVMDAHAGALVADAACRAAVAIARANLGGMDNRDYVEDVERRAVEIERTAARAVDRVTETVERRG